MTIDTNTTGKDQTQALAARLRCRIDRPVVLVGMMGVGKSTIGRKLGQLLDLKFVDADEEIERAAQMPITEIFERFGEAHFRDGERRVIARLMEQGPAVIATGGGAFVQPETQALILERGLTIWLDCDVDTLVDRVTRKDTRPLLRGGNPREIVTRLKADREPAYARAAVHVQSDTGPQSETVNRILQAIDSWL
jgi:shikimate kinase